MLFILLAVYWTYYSIKKLLSQIYLRVKPVYRWTIDYINVLNNYIIFITLRFIRNICFYNFIFILFILGLIILEKTKTIFKILQIKNIININH